MRFDADAASDREPPAYIIGDRRESTQIHEMISGESGA